MSYDPSKSRVSVDAMAKFLGSPLQEDVRSVPGVGDAAQAKLAAAGVHNTFQLVGKCLSLYEPHSMETDAEKEDVSHKIWEYLDSVGINAYRSGIVTAMMEKIDSYFPGFSTLRAEDK